MCSNIQCLEDAKWNQGDFQANRIQAFQGLCASRPRDFTDSTVPVVTVVMRQAPVPVNHVPLTYAIIAVSFQAGQP